MPRRPKFRFLVYKLFSFIRRDLLINLSYKFEFFLNCLTIFIFIGIAYFVAKLIDKSSSSYLVEYGGKYFPFVFIGILFYGFLSQALSSFSRNIRREQMIGTLEAMFVTPTKVSTIILSSSLWNFVFNLVTFLIYSLFAVLLFRVNFAGTIFLTLIVILPLTIVSFGCIGIIASAFIIVFKKGDPINWAINLFSAFFGGVYFPITLLPSKLRLISHIFPMTYCLRASRLALLKGYGLELLLPDIVALLGFCIILIPLSLMIFKFAVKKAKIDGTLTHY